MSYKEDLTNPVKMYWQDFPLEDVNTIKNVLPNGVYCEPGKIMNSTHVHVEAKPWLQKSKTKKKENKKQNPAPFPTIKTQVVANKNSTSQEVKSNVGKEIEAKSSIKTKQHNVVAAKISKAECTLAELRKEDKQRVADLVREMAKFSEEKEKAVYELTNLKTNFSSKMKALEKEKQNMIIEQDSLKEKLLRYELILKEIKDKQRSEDSNNSVESILKNHASLYETALNLQDFDKQPIIAEASADKFPGNLKKVRQCPNKKLSNKENKEEVKKANEFTDLFFKQQDKFHQQQEILQKQIEQLLKLQESILEQQQQQQLKESHVESKAYSSNEQQVSTALGIDNNESCLFDDSQKGKYSIKLQNYISKQPKYETCIDGLKKKPDTNPPPVQVLVSDTIIEDDSRNNTLNLISVQCLNASNKSAKVDSAVQTITDMAVQTDVPVVKSKLKSSSKQEDVCLQTEEPVVIIETKKHKQLGNPDNMHKLESCRNHIERLEESIKDLSSQKLVPTANIHKSSVVGKSKINKENKSISEKIQMKEISLPNEDYDDDVCDDIVNRNTSVSSALQRGHFQPDSILDLIDGLEPPSASTSISTSYRKISPPKQQYRKVSRKTPLSPVKQSSCHQTLSPSNRLSKAKTKGERSNKLHKVYSTLKAKQQQNQNVSKQRSLEEREEQKMLADVFFVR